MNQQELLTQLETEMETLLNVDKKNWVNFYLILRNVEENKLYKPEYHSFTQWVKNFCMRTKTHETVVWTRLKAGKVYENYEKVKEKQGVEVKPLEESNVSADSLVILDKINKYDEITASKLVDKVMANDLKKSELRDIYRRLRPPVDEISNNPHYHKDKALNPNIKTDKITANDIVIALYDKKWLGNTEIERNFFKNNDFRPKYKSIPEFAVYTGSTRKSRRIDVLTIENITSPNPWEITLHGIEIKVEKNDLINDQKYTEYAEFVDYMWLAIPIELVSIAQENKYNECGIILVEKTETGEIVAKMIESATKVTGTRRNETLEKLVLKLINKYQ